ncbi:MAG: radical SAM protein [Candidatus Omnitrophota bacterium]
MQKEFHFQWHITNSCNLRCLHCYQEDFTNIKELSWPELKKVSDNILETLDAWNKVTRINLTGGEPLLKKDLNLLLDYLNQKTQVKELSLITNLLLLDKQNLKELNDFSKLKKIKFSLEGLSSETCDFVRGEGVFNKILASLDLLKANKGFKKTLMFTLLKRNLKDLPKIFNFCCEFDMESVILERFIPWGNGIKLKDQVLSSQEWQGVVNHVLELCQSYSAKEDLFRYKAFWIKFHPNSLPELFAANCNILEDSLCIMPNADIFPCRRFNLAIGNLTKDSLKDIWEHSSILNEIRKKENLKGKCRSCAIKNCHGCRALAYALTNDYLAQDPQCWYSDI